MAKQNNQVRMTLPKAIAQYPHLNKPDTKFNADGEYKTGLVFDMKDEATVKLKEKLDSILAKAEREMGKDKPIDDVNVPYKLDDETGNLTLNVKQKAFTYEKQTILPKPAFFDAKGKPMEEIPLIRGGSSLRVAVTVVPYMTQEKDRRLGRMIRVVGLTMRPNAVQIIELSKGTGGSASEFGFGAEEGFEAEEGFDAYEEDSVENDEDTANDDF